MLTGLLRRLAGGKRTEAAPLDGAVVFVCDTPQAMPLAADHALAPLQASLRMRVLAPARTLARHAPVWAIPPVEFLQLARERRLDRPFCVVFGKIATASLKADRATFDALLDWAAGAAMPLFADFCDNYAEISERTGSAFFASYQDRLARQCRPIASCEALREVIAPLARGPVEVIEDPYESARALPVRAPTGPDLRLCWFGNLAPATLAPVAGALRAIARRFAGRKVALDCVTGAHQRHLVDAMATELAALHGDFAVRIAAWSPAAVAAALEGADLVLLPQDATSGWGRVKSHNRLVESIRAGRLAVASPIPSYLELRDFAWVGDDLADGIAWALANPDAAAARVARGQPVVAERFSPERIGERWRQVLGL